MSVCHECSCVMKPLVSGTFHMLQACVRVHLLLSRLPHTQATTWVCTVHEVYIWCIWTSTLRAWSWDFDHFSFPAEFVSGAMIPGYWYVPYKLWIKIAWTWLGISLNWYCHDLCLNCNLIEANNVMRWHTPLCNRPSTLARLVFWWQRLSLLL